MDIQSLETFLQVAHLENFTKTAEVMNYAQSTVTMQIKRLEQELGFPLFERIGRKNHLTAAGEAFLPQAAEILRILQKVRALNINSAEIQGTLRIGVLESIMFTAILAVLPQFSVQFPNIDVMLKIGQSTELLTLLKQNQLDFIYISNSMNTDKMLHCCYRRAEEIIFTAWSGHPLARRKKIPIAELLHYPFIVAEPSGRCYSRLQEIAGEQNITLRHSVIVDNIHAIATLQLNTDKISFLPAYSLEKQLNRGELVRLDVDLPPQIYYSQILYHNNKWIPPYMEAFIDLVRIARPEKAEI
ncbi:MAG: LysR family transcriptional regulator [Lachnospiraceae bacterium]|nr:LysR family transcriptional regulator [Lachnospiraceae bacterium]